MRPEKLGSPVNWLRMEPAERADRAVRGEGVDKSWRFSVNGASSTRGSLDQVSGLDYGEPRVYTIHPGSSSRVTLRSNSGNLSRKDSVARFR